MLFQHGLLLGACAALYLPVKKNLCSKRKPNLLDSKSSRWSPLLMVSCLRSEFNSAGMGDGL